jgi:integrase/recombinase XerD
MSSRSSLPSLLESFFRDRMTKQRNASPSTIASYLDALRMLILFASEHTQRKPCALTVANLDRDLVLAFLDNLEQARKNTIQTRNARWRRSGHSSTTWQPMTPPRFAFRSASS